jgi:hypothetical protein
VTVDRFSKLVYGTAGAKPEEFFNLIVNIVHDRLDASILDPAQAVEVENARGDPPWKLSGDKSLAQSPETLKISRDAVAASFRNLEQAAKTPETFGDDLMIQSVWDYTPKPTEAGAVKMDAVIKDALNYAGQPTIDAFAATTIANLDFGIAELEKMGYMRPAGGAAPAPAPAPPAPAPQPAP